MNRAAACLSALLPLLCTGCERIPLPDWSFLPHQQADKPLKDVLPGRWKATAKGNTCTITFGRHSDVAYVIDVPQGYRARLGVDQLFIGGNYHLESDHAVNCQLTEGRWAEMLAQMKGLELHRIGIKSYSENELLDAEDVTWKRVGPAPSQNMGEAVDIADQAPTVNDAPRARAAAKSGAPPTTMYDQQTKLTVLYNQLEAKRGKLNVKDKAAVAAFNKEAAEYARQVAALNAPAASPPAPAKAAAQSR